MQKVLLYSFLLLLGLIASQWLPAFFGPAYMKVADIVRVLTMIGLSFIMIHVGYEFDIDKSNLKQYGWDYVVAFTAAGFPWIFVTLYFVFVLLPPDVWGLAHTWKETLLAGRFAAPTSAGVLFSMLAAAGLEFTWVFRKARILAIFDDLDTVLLMIPLKMLIVGLAWQLGVVVVVMVLMLAVAYLFLHKVRIPVTWPWVLAYSIVIAVVSELVYKSSKLIDESVPIHIEVLLPAFVLGCVLAYPKPRTELSLETAGSQSTCHDAHEVISTPTEKRVSMIVAAVFMVLVGLSMPLIEDGQTMGSGETRTQLMKDTMRAGGSAIAESAAADIGVSRQLGRITAAQPGIGWGWIMLHVFFITILSNLGKMFPSLCYRKEAHWRERLAVAIGMWPRGEVGAGVLVISMSYGIGGPIVTVAMLSLALNLLLTGLFIFAVKQLISPLST